MFAEQMIAPLKIAEMKIAGLIVELSNARTLAYWMRNAWWSSAGLHFVGLQKTPEWNSAAEKRTVQLRSAELPEQLWKTAGSKFDKGCLKLTSAPQLWSAELSAAVGQLGQGVRRSVPQWSVQRRFAGLRKLAPGKDSKLLHFRSPRLRLRSGYDLPLSAQASSCSHFLTACLVLSGCKNLIQQRYIKTINLAYKTVSFLTVIDLNTAMSCKLPLCFRFNTET